MDQSISGITRRRITSNVGFTGAGGEPRGVSSLYVFSNLTVRQSTNAVVVGFADGQTGSELSLGNAVDTTGSI